MKKILSLVLLTGVLLVCLTGCTQNKARDTDKIKIMTTVFPQYSFAKELAGDKCEVSMLIPPGGESHSFEPTTSDILELSKCDIFIYTGGESDGWIDGILATVNNPKMKTVSLVDCVETIETTDDHNHSKTDEHVWTSPINAIAICEKITEVLKSVDEENASYYDTQLASYKEKLNTLDLRFRDIAENGVRNTMVFGDRFPLTYFAHEYGLEYKAAFPGCSEDTEVSASTVKELVDYVKGENIPVVYKIELSSGNIADTIADETGAEVMTFYSCHNISKDDFEKGESYLSLMEKNAESLKIALY